MIDTVARRRSRILFLLSLLVSLTATTARAEDSDARARASIHFQRAAALVQEGTFDGAAREFEKAYELSPHFTTRYNLGQCYLALNQPLAAADAFTRYLEEAGNAVGAAERKRIETLIREQRTKLALVKFELQPADAEILVDEKPTPHAEAGVWLNPGPHDVRVRRDGYVPRIARIELVSGPTLVLLQLTEKPSPTQTDDFGVLDVRCPIPDVRVLFRQQQTVRSFVLNGSAPTSLVVPSGPSTIVFERAGYERDEQVAEVRTGAPHPISCRLRPLRGAPTGTLTVNAADGVNIEINGRPGNARRLPPGPHGVSATFGSGSARWQQTVQVQANRTTTVVLPHTKVPERTGERRTLAWAIAGSGLVAASAGLVTYFVSADQHADYEREQSSLNREFASGRANSTTVRRQHENDQRGQMVQTLDASAAALFGAGATMVVGGFLLLVLDR
jgi:Tfp pilus assembly protein PilF